MLKQFDLFPRIKEESRRTTVEGGIISLVGIIIGLLLIINETVDFFSVHKVEHLELFDPMTTPGVPHIITMHLEIDFFNLKCDRIAFQMSTATTTQDFAGAWEIKQQVLLPTLRGGGCLLNVTVDMLKYESGEMHVALAPQSSKDGFTLDEYFAFNVSHKVMRFALSSKSMEFAPKIVAVGGTGRFVYDFSIVPERELGDATNSEVKFVFQCREQDLVTHNVDEGMFALQRLGLPGVFFTVKMSNLMIETNKVDQLWYSYLINVLGIAAGVPALVTLVDSALHEVLWKRKLD